MMIYLLGAALQNDVLIVKHSSSRCSVSILVFSGVTVPLQVTQQDSDTVVFQKVRSLPNTEVNFVHSYLYHLLEIYDREIHSNLPNTLTTRSFCVSNLIHIP